MADSRTNSDNRHLQNLTSASFVHLTAAVTGKVIKDKPGRLLRVILNTNGGAVTVRNGSEVIGIIAADAPEATFDYGVYCNNSIKVDVANTCDVTIIYD